MAHASQPVTPLTEIRSDVPREALRQFLLTYGLDYEIREGVIHIRELGSP